jgi:hypothetical protein
MGYRGAKINPTTNPDSVLAKITEASWPIKVFAKINTFDKAVFPTKGTKFIFISEYNFNVSHKAGLNPQFSEDTQNDVNDVLYVDPFFSFRVGAQQYIPLKEKFSLYLGAEIKFNSQEKVGFNDLSKVGGITPILYSSNPFWGADRDEIIIRQFIGFSAGFQWNFVSDLYLKGKINYLNTEYPMAWMFPNQKITSFELYGKTHTGIFGFGGEIAYNSPIGPVRLILHQNQYSNDLNVFVAVGFNIYKSFGDF